LRRRDDETALALADRRDEVDDPRRDGVLRGLQAQTLVRVQRGELGEVHSLAGPLDGHAADGVDLHERGELALVLAALAAAVAAAAVVLDLLDALLLALAGRLDLPGHGIALAQRSEEHTSELQSRA